MRHASCITLLERLPNPCSLWGLTCGACNGLDEVCGFHITLRERLP